MRKIDAVLLSALILYDYSAQSLVDRDIINLGSSFITEHNNFQEDKLAEPSLFPDSYNATLTSKNAELLSPHGSDATAAKNISYYDLAKVNPATAITTSQSEDIDNSVIHISTPDPLIEEALMLPETEELVAEESSLALSAATVSVSFTSLSDAANIEVKDEFDAGNMQFADTDADGMFNFEDKCPTIAGVARFDGCPVPDSDADGINDEEDRCPFEAGSIALNGCAAEGSISAIDNTRTANNQLDATAFLTVVKFDETNEVLSNKDFNLVLQLTDKALANNSAKIDIFRSVDSNSVAQVHTVVQYLKDLGVKDAQINVSEKNIGANTVVGGVEVQIRY